MEKPTPSQWYGEQIVGINSLRKVVGSMLKDGKLDGYFTNHNLRRSGTTRLFQNGIDRKLVKEFMGHSSDAVDNYQVTSDEQRAQMSKIIQGGGSKNVSNRDSDAKLEVSMTNKCETGSMSCCCNGKEISINETNGKGDMIGQILKACKGGKATIKIELQFDN